MTAPIRSALIRRPQIIVSAAHSVLALQNSELVPAEFVDAVLRLGTRDARACAAVAHKMQLSALLCSEGQAAGRARPEHRPAVAARGAPRPRGVCPCGARVSQGRVPPRPPTAIGAWWIVWSEPRPEVLGPAGSRKLPQGKTRPFLIASFHRFRAVTPYSRPPLP